MLRFNLLFGTAARVGGCAFAHYQPRSPRPPADTSFGATFPQSEPCAPPFIPFPTTPPQNLKDFQPVSPEHDRFRKIYAAREKRPPRRAAAKSLVEARRIELRSILNCPQGATGLVSDRASERIGSQTNVAAPSRFGLSRGHTDYVPRGIPLK